jgi:tripartite-type tricarboxylate transporter receptor subunit TctC
MRLAGAMTRRLAWATALSVLVAAGGASAEPAPNFAGKTVTLLVGSEPGGGTDAAGRLLAEFLRRELPGHPAVVVQNKPGAQGITALNYFTQRSAPDGLTIAMGSTTQSDPLLYRRPQSFFDPTQFEMIGGLGRGGELMMLRKDARPRLLDRSKKPVVIGTIGGVVRSGTLTAAWGVKLLGWNIRWVLGYRGTNDLLTALQRGEIDLISEASSALFSGLVSSGEVAILCQTGTLRDGKLTTRPEFGDVPMFNDMVRAHLTDPIAEDAFRYWASLTSLDKWFALPPHTPKAIVDVYRSAFDKVKSDPKFRETGRRISADLVPQDASDVTSLVRAIGAATPEAMEYVATMLEEQRLTAH